MFFLSKELAFNFFKEAREHRMKGNYEMAKDSMTRAISYDPESPEIYYENGKLNFQLGNYITSINSYMAFTHLMLNKRVKELEGEIEFENKEESEKFYESLPQEVKEVLPHKAASYILEDGDICNHIAHSFIASQNIEEKDIVNNLKLYHATLVSYLLTEMTLNQFDLDLDTFKKMNDEFFIPQGRILLLENIDWEKLGNNDVLDIYFK